MSALTPILEIIAQTLKLINPSESKQTRKNIRMGFKNYKRIRKIMKRGGINPEEIEALDNMIHLLVKAQNKLLK